MVWVATARPPIALDTRALKRSGNWWKPSTYTHGDCHRPNGAAEYRPRAISSRMDEVKTKRRRKPKQDVQPVEADVTPKLGRPTKYQDEYAQAMLAFFSKGVGVFPTLAGFAASIGVSRETLHDWATAKDANGDLRNATFSDAYKRAKELQENNLVEGALTGAYNPTFAIFTAKNVLGWRDKVEQEITGKDGSPLQSIQVMFVSPDGTDRANS